MKTLLDEILLSENVVENFYKNYENNSEFRKWIFSVLPEIEHCKNQKQDNPWHIYNCLDHILHSVEEINKQTKNLDFSTRKNLAYTMFLHDIGKPEKHIRRYSKLYNREVDSFFGHNIASVKIANRVLQHFGLENKNSEVIKKMIEMHDIFMFITLDKTTNPHHNQLSKQYIEKEIKNLDCVGDGKQLMKYLIMVGRADNKAQNPQMTTGSLHLLDVMDSMLEEMQDQVIL